MWRWLRDLWGTPMPADVPAEPIDPAPLDDHDEGTVKCCCGLWKSRHGGIMICHDCDLIDFMPGGVHELTRLEPKDE